MKYLKQELKESDTELIECYKKFQKILDYLCHIKVYPETDINDIINCIDDRLKKEYDIGFNHGISEGSNE